jgi:excisionase family DNA binding protein
MTTHRPYVEHGAIVSGGPTWMISRILASPSVRDLLDNPPAWIERGHLAATVDAIHQAARAFEAESAARERGKPATVSAVAAQSEWTTREAADYLGLSQRRVQEIAADLGGTQAGRRWRIPATAAREYQRRRKETA